MLVVLLIIAIVAFSIIRERIIQYWKWKKVCTVGSEKPTNLEQQIFFKAKKEMGRRILEMKRAKKYKAVLPVVMTVLICIIGGITTLAYDSPQTIYNDTGYDLGTDINFVVEPEGTKQAELPSDYFFVDDNGKTYDLNKMEENSRILCNHDFSIHGTLNDHKKDGNGGCVTNSYEAWRCSICSAIKTGELKSTLTYKSCPH